MCACMCACACVLFASPAAQKLRFLCGVFRGVAQGLPGPTPEKSAWGICGTVDPREDLSEMNTVPPDPRLIQMVKRAVPATCPSVCLLKHTNRWTER